MARVGILGELGFWQTIGVELLKALFTALFVAVAAVLLVNSFQNRADERRSVAEAKRAEEAKAREQALLVDEAKRATKTSFVTRTSELAGSFYFATQRYWRQKNDRSLWGDAVPGELDGIYITWAAAAESLEYELKIRYGWGTRPPELWHQVRDLLTVRYFDLRDRNTPGLRGLNAKNPEHLHSGLSEEELTHMNLVLNTYRGSMQSLSHALLDSDVTV